ncbi:MAG: TPM domain-containing protein [Bacteroidota bacterium]|nr:TPM domain-containing protein [Bacteroidota bacterium]
MKRNSISLEEKRLILKAVIDAERFTSVEFQIHIDNECKVDVKERAAGIFKILHMNKSKKKNWVLFYFSIDDLKYAIVGDEGLDLLVTPNFWNDVISHMKQRISEGNLAGSLSEGIKMAGEKLKLIVPKQKNDINELPDEIVFGSDIQELVDC